MTDIKREVPLASAALSHSALAVAAPLVPALGTNGAANLDAPPILEALSGHADVIVTT